MVQQLYLSLGPSGPIDNVKTVIIIDYPLQIIIDSEFIANAAVVTEANKQQRNKDRSTHRYNVVH